MWWFDDRGLSDTKCTARPKSPGPCSRGPTSPTSPLHTRLSGINLDSPQSGRQEDSRSPCHPLPLPPGSPTSPSSLPNNRNGGALESPTFTLSKWKRGRLLGRGTFGQVYLGFNRYLYSKICLLVEELRCLTFPPSVVIYSRWLNLDDRWKTLFMFFFSSKIDVFVNLSFCKHYSEGGQMCAIKEVRIASDDQTLKESFKQLNQVNCLTHFM